MKLNRQAIKNQAKQLISGWVFKLFVIAFVVSLLTGASVSLYSNVRNVSHNNSGYSDENTLDEYDTYPSGGDFIDTFKWSFTHHYLPYLPLQLTGFSISSVFAIVFAPLEMALCGLFLLFVNGRRMEIGDEFNYVFTNGFDKRFGNKLLLGLVKNLIVFLMSLLLIVPGIVYSYKYFFTSYIIAENPHLSWSEALKLSDKMTMGHKGELFELSLSFIPWYLLVAISLGIANIYFLPYYQTVIAMYYYNFKARGLQTGELTQADFIGTPAA